MPTKSRRIYAFRTLIVSSVLALTCFAADNVSDISKRIDDSAKVLDEVMTSKDHAAPAGVITRAQCVAVFPAMVEVAALVGGKRGKGFVSCRTSNGWSAPAPLTVTGGNWGAQFGGETVDLVLIITSAKGLQDLESGKVDVGVEASATAGTKGTHHWTMNSDIVTYARSKGVFAGTNLDGSSIRQDEDETKQLYGQPVSLADILGGKTKIPANGSEFTSKVAQYAGQKPAKN